MTDWAGIAILATATFSGLSTLITAIVGSWILIQQNRNVREMKGVVATVAAVKTDIKELTVNTNSIKDALVKSTGEAAYAKGVSDQKAIQTRKE